MMTEDQARLAGQALQSVKEIISVDFTRTNPRWISEAAFALLMIHLKDALQLLKLSGQRVDFTDDVTAGDVTDLISNMRNAICHIGSPLRRIGNQGTLSFCTAFGKGVLLSTPTLTLENPYEDDVAFFYGEHRVFLRRHIHRSYAEARNRLKTTVETNGWWFPYDL